MYFQKGALPQSNVNPLFTHVSSITHHSSICTERQLNLVLLNVLDIMARAGMMN